MNRRQRVLKALNHQPADRVPVDMGGMASTGILAAAYVHLREYLGLPPVKVRVNDVGQQLAEINEDLLELYGVDALDLNRTLAPARVKSKVMDWPILDFSRTPVETIQAEMLCEGLAIRRASDGWEIFDESGLTRYKKPDTSYYFDPVSFRLAGATTIAEIAADKWINPPTAKHLAKLRHRAEYLRKNTDYALMSTFGGNILEMGQSLRGWGQFMLDLAMGGVFTQYLLDAICDRWMENLGLFMEALGDQLDIIVFGDDLGTQASTQLSVEMYRRLIHPRHKKLYGYVREHYPNVHVFIHCCGAIRPLLPLLIDEGVQIINPVQTSAAGMDPRELKREFGRDLVFWGGGVDTQHTMPLGTPAEVRRMVLERMEIFSDGGGFVFNQIHNLQASVPLENIVAMMQAVREFNGLPPIEVPATGRLR
jgi:uroporphyrinogen decarboxylase